MGAAKQKVAHMDPIEKLVLFYKKGADETCPKYGITKLLFYQCQLKLCVESEHTTLYDNMARLVQTAALLRLIKEEEKLTEFCIAQSN